MLIAIVDDDEGIRISLSRMLRAYGFETKAFSSAEAFLESRHVSNTSCLILDVRMPGRDGLELQRLLRKEGHRLPIIFITGYLDDEVRADALKNGASDILEKPFEDDVLIGKIKKAVLAHGREMP